ncbi:MAG: hypothetical protein ACLQUY_17350 [Ktedonobacterales bacterium]
MSNSRTAKPLVSSLLALLFVLCFVLPFLQFDYLAGPITPFDEVQAGSIRWGVILTVALIWLGVQLFWKAPVDASKLGLTASATICWLSLTLLFGFKDQSLDAGQRGAVAFFALMGGLGITLLWLHYLSDDVKI